MKIRCQFSLFAMVALVGCATPTTTSMYTPWQLEEYGLSAPSNDVPDNCARFFSPTGWGRAKWGGVQATELWVAKVFPDCTVDAYIMWGDLASEGLHAGYAEAVNAKIEGDVLSFEAEEAGLFMEVTYTISENGDRLYAVWQEKGQPQTKTTATLRPREEIRDGISVVEGR